MCLLLSTGCKDKQVKPADVSTKTTESTEVIQSSTKEEKMKILCFGNSLTAGYGLDEQDAWPSLLQNRLDSFSLPYTVINAGLSGETTAGGLSRIDWVLREPIDIFFLELGANDMLRGLDATKTEENLDSIIIRVHQKNPDIPIVLAGMLSPPNMGKEYEKIFNASFPKLANKHKAVLIPFFLNNVAGIKDLNLSDGIHPNEQGSKIILETVWAAMEKILSSD